MHKMSLASRSALVLFVRCPLEPHSGTNNAAPECLQARLSIRRALRHFCFNVFQCAADRVSFNVSRRLSMCVSVSSNVFHCGSMCFGVFLYCVTHFLH